MVQKIWVSSVVLAAATACATAGGTATRAVRTETEAQRPAPVEPGAEGSAGLATLADARRALAENRFADAERLFRAAADAAPSDPDAPAGLAQALHALSRPAEADAAVERSLAIRETAGARAVRGRQRALARRFDEAAADLERAAALDPARGLTFATLAAVQVNRGDDLEARWAFGEARRLLGANDALERFWTELLAMPPDPTNPQESLERSTRGCAEMMVENWKSAWREFLVAIRYSREYQWAIVGVAESSWRMADAEIAERLFRQAIPKFPQRLEGLRADAQGKLAALLVERGRPEEARDLAREALRVRGDRGHLLATLGRACDALGDAECARDAFARLVRRPHVPDDLRRLAAARGAPATASN